MLKRTFTYVDYNGVERTEDHFFNLTKAEVTELELSVSGGFVEMMNRIIAAKDAPTIMKTFKEIICKSYGVKSPDGKYFLKKAPDGHYYYEDFLQTEAYSVLFMELITDADAASNFVKAILPVKVDNAKPVTTN